MAKYKMQNGGGTIIEAVCITAADYIQNSFNCWPDGFPFSDGPDWLINAIADKKIKAVGIDADYAMWDVYTVDGVRRVGPDDYIVQVGNKVDICGPLLFNLLFDKIN